MKESIDLSSHWASVRERIKESETSITDADLEYTPGKEDELYNRLSKKFNKTALEIKEWIESLAVNRSMAG